MRYLLCRFGGIGDTIILTVAARAIKEKSADHVVHMAVREELMGILEDNPSIDEVLPLRRMSPGHVDCLSRELGWVSLASVAPEYDMPIDYRYSIEANGHYGHLAPLVGGWIESQSSNYQNWIDLTLGWANIDPTTVRDKTPFYHVRPAEDDWASEQLAGHKPVIAINMSASSRTRTRANSHELVGPILAAFPEYTAIWWCSEEQTWVKVNRNGAMPFARRTSLRESVALLGQCSVLVAMDSGLSHMAEAVAGAIGLKTLCFYTTVPGWTRAKYFPNCRACDTDVSCGPCFNLHENCPRERRRAFAQLSRRERRLADLMRPGVPLGAVCHELGCTPARLREEVQLVQQRLTALGSAEPECTRRITSERIVAELRLLLRGGQAPSADEST